MFKPTKKQHVVNKAYVDQNGGGSTGLPAITPYDIGQTLTVVADFDNVSPKEVIPEQQITIVDREVEVTADWGSYAPSSMISAKMTFDGIEYDAVFDTDHYGVEITDEMFVHVRAEDGESSTTTFVNVTDDRGHEIPGDYNISFTIMAPGVKWGFEE